MTDKGERRKRRMGQTGILLSIFLFAMKTWAGVLSGSIAVISDALNSFLDILAYSAVYISIRVQDRSADENHPFGHRRAEPLAGLLFAVFASVLGATILRDAFVGLYQTSVVQRSPLSFGLITGSIVLKVAMSVWYLRGWKSLGSPALRASYVDSRNDVLASTLALLGFVVGNSADDLAALVIGGWIIYSGARVGLENIGYLMGKAPSTKVMESIRREAMQVAGIIGLNDMRAHYVGDRIHVELHIEVDQGMTLDQAHDIGVDVRSRLERIDMIHKAFIHIDPV